MITVLLVDDAPRVRSGLRMRLALESDLAVIGEAGDGQQALTLAQHLHPDVAVMDVAMPGLDGIAATAALRQHAPTCAVVMLSMHDDSQTRARARAAGAAAFVAKQADTAPLLAAIRRAAAQRSRPDA